MASPFSASCAYCGAPWTEQGFQHSEMCYVISGHLTRAAAKRAKEQREKNRPAKLGRLLDLDDE